MKTAALFVVLVAAVSACSYAAGTVWAIPLALALVVAGVHAARTPA